MDMQKGSCTVFFLSNVSSTMVKKGCSSPPPQKKNLKKKKRKGNVSGIMIKGDFT